MLTPLGPHATVPPHMALASRRILAIDIGTSSIKIGVISSDGTLLAEHRRTLVAASSSPEGWDVGVWDEALREALIAMGQEYPEYQGVDGIAVSGNGPTIIPVDGSGAPLTPVLLWFDSRGHRREGARSFYLPKIQWLRNRHPDVYDRAAGFYSCPEFFAFRFTGEAWTITPNDEFTPYLWSDDEIEGYGVDKEKLPPFVPMAGLMGRVTREAAESYGLKEGTPVFASGSDFLASLIGTGTVHPGRTCDRAGTSEGINHCHDSYVDDPRLRCLPHAVEGLYNVAGILASTGRIFEWFRSISGQQRVPYTTTLVQILDVGLEHHVPWFFPSIHQGAAWEFSRGMFIDLGAQHGAPEMGRAVVESIGFAVREAVEILGQGGCEISELRVCGGQAKNDIWNQLKSDMIGKPLAIPEVADAELLGSAACALVGLGDYSGFVEAADQLVRFPKRFEPNPERFAVFGEKYHRYQEAYGRFRRALSECGALFFR